ncbi:MAG: diguanylate cyclase [Phenylobacterium sp.]|jgi:diguanylate cyclase
MKYQDSVAQSNDIMAQVMVFLNRYLLAANPVNYAVVYEHISGINPALSQVIEKRVKALQPFDNFIMDSFYTDWVLKQTDLQENIVEHLDEMLGGIQQQSSDSDQAIEYYVNTLEQGMESLDDVSDMHSKRVISRLIRATGDMKNQQQQLQQQLQQSAHQSEGLRQTLAEIHRERTTDTLTGLSNGKVIQPNMNDWLTEVPERDITAISIDIDHFGRFNDQFGPHVSDVILAKVAKKISTYVSQSGLPVRIGGEAFLILLPDVDIDTATEVAEQVRQGVSKMKFVSARSKRQLPNVTISLGISSYRDNEDPELFVARADHALSHAKSTGRNKVISENGFS